MPVSRLEPRVAKVETELEAVVGNLGLLSSDVRSLAASVRQQGDNFDLQMRQLHVAVTSAAGPRKMQWEAIIAAVALIMAIGASALSPLYLRMADVQTDLKEEQLARTAHEQLKLHPVGETRINAMEQILKEGRDRNSEAIRELDAKLQKEYSLINDTLKERLVSQAALIKELDDRLQKEFPSFSRYTYSHS